MSNIIFVRERRKAEKGEKRPRFRVVGTVGDIRISVEHIRKRELDEIAAASGVQVIFLSKDGEGKEGCAESE